MKYDLHATINNLVDHIFSLRDQLLLDKDETVELLQQVRNCKSVDDVMNLAISDPEDFLVRLGLYHPRSTSLQCNMSRGIRGEKLKQV